MRRNITTMKKLSTLFALLLMASVIFTSCERSELPPQVEEGVIINGIRWATRNVAVPGRFAENPSDAGAFYQWNRQAGWRHIDPLLSSDGSTTWDNSTPTGTVWERVNDPCPQGWRVPTHAELLSLFESASIWAVNNGVSGRFFGTAPNQIFLPAAGSRGIDEGALNRVGIYGMYWSSTQCLTNENIAPSMFFGEGFSVGRGSSWRASGYSVRCVADIPAASVTLNKTTIELSVGSNEILVATVLPANVNPNVIWNSSNPAVATVNHNGFVMAVSTGTAVITVTTANNEQTASVTVTVSLPPQTEEGVVINGIRWATRNVDAPGIFTATPESLGMLYQWNGKVGWSNNDPLRGTDGSTTLNRWWSPQEIIWERDNDPCPEGWRIPAEYEWQSLVDASSIWTTSNGVYGSFFGVAPHHIFLPAAGRRFSTGEHVQLAVGFYWSNNTPWQGSQAYHMSFNIFGAGLFNSIKSNAQSIRCVEDGIALEGSISLNKSELTLSVGDTETLIATATSGNSDNPLINWTSNNPAVATVDNNGKVTAVSVGTATIFAVATGGNFVATCEVTIYPFISNSLDGVAINGIRWATRNVDASGYFADSPLHFGMFFQWNRIQGWASWASSGHVSNWNNTGAEGIEWESANDPCPDGWRVPSMTELVSLYNSGNIWMKYKGVAGRLFGTAPNQIFLPEAGTRTGNYSGSVHVGRYWSSTPCEWQPLAARMFSFDAHIIWEPDQPAWRNTGASVRCIAIE